MSRKKSNVFPNHEKPVSFIFFWTFLPGVAAAILVTVMLLVIAVIVNERDLRLIGIPIIAAAFLFSLIGFVASSVYAFVKFVISRRKDPS